MNKEVLEFEMYERALHNEKQKYLMKIIFALLLVIIELILTIVLTKVGENIDERCICESEIKAN